MDDGKVGDFENNNAREAFADITSQKVGSGDQNSRPRSSSKNMRRRRLHCWSLCLPPASSDMIQCRIVRERSNGILGRFAPRFYFYQQVSNSKLDDKLILVAERKLKSRSSNIHIFDARGMSNCESIFGTTDPKAHKRYIGKVRSQKASKNSVNYSFFGAERPHRLEHGAAVFDTSREKVGDPTGPLPRMLRVVLPHMSAEGELPKDLRGAPLFNMVRQEMKRGSNTLGSRNDMSILINRAPKPDKTGVFRLNFHGRVKKSSVKNFQLMRLSGKRLDQAAPENLLQFGRVDKKNFHLDFSAPLTPMQAFCIALTQFDK